MQPLSSAFDDDDIVLREARLVRPSEGDWMSSATVVDLDWSQPGCSHVSQVPSESAEVENGFNNDGISLAKTVNSSYKMVKIHRNIQMDHQTNRINPLRTTAKFILLIMCMFEIVIEHCMAADREEGPTKFPIGPNTTYISQVLNRLTDRSKYDKRLRPRYGEGPVDVGITIHVSSISAVSEVNMDFTLDFYLRQTWQDPRLAFGEFDKNHGSQANGLDKIKSLTVGVDYLDRLWKPDTFFPNEKKSFFHVATTHNSFLRIEPDGRVFTSQRLTVTATCPMELQLFPMDTQTCKLEIESYGYTTADIDYFWGMRKTDEREQAVAFADFTLPQFRRNGYRVNITKARTASGEYVRLYFEIILSRALGFYLMNIIIPSMLIVTISWVSFWLNREASPARVGLGVTTVLTITTVITTTNNSMPKVSYVKGLDVFLNFCFVMVFASLVEYAVVSYMNKKLNQRRDKKRKRAEAAPNTTTEFPMFANYAPMSPNQNSTYSYRAPGLPGSAATATIANHAGTTGITPAVPSPDCDCRAIPLMQYSQMPQDGSFRPMQVPYGKRRRPTRCCRYVSPSKIDKCSRYMFPVIFFTFNLAYWFIMWLLSDLTATKDYKAFV
uniref:Gamma-aminobutyric acid receptor subunit beta n=1 Tax=Panagrellus redivivus TaxID=6233 RepID=A0A7E4VX42_PANRE